MIKGIIFDCFGVLAEDGWAPFKHQYLADPDKALAVAEIGKAVDEGRRTYEDMTRETARIAGVSEEIVKSAVGHKVPNKPLFAYIEENLMSRYKIGLLSNASYNVLEYLFTPDQASIFDATALSYEIGLVKPRTDMFHAIAARLGLEPEQCLLVDDQKRHIIGAEAAGMKAVLYTTIEQLKTDLVTHLSYTDGSIHSETAPNCPANPRRANGHVCGISDQPDTISEQSSSHQDMRDGAPGKFGI